MRWTWALYADYSPDGDNLRAGNVNNQWTLNTQEGVEGVLTLGRGTTYICCMKQQCLKGCRPLQWVVWVWSRGKRRQRQRAGEAVSWSSPDKHIPPKSLVQICNCSCFDELIMLTSCCLFLILGGRDTLASSTSQLLLERIYGYWIVPLFPQLHELFLNFFSSGFSSLTCWMSWCESDWERSPQELPCSAPETFPFEQLTSNQSCWAPLESFP